MTRQSLVAFAVALAVWSPCVRADFVAYVVPAGVVGNQTDSMGDAFGMDFNVNSPITITELGVFDSGQTGLIAPITVQLYNRSSPATPVAQITFAAGSGPASGTLNGGSLFLPITPITLPAGFQGSIVTSGYGNGIAADADGNSFDAATGTAAFPWTTDTGGGLISFVGDGRFSVTQADVFPTIIDTGPANRYAAGTFTFTAAVPEPSSIVMAALAATGLAVPLLRRSRH